MDAMDLVRRVFASANAAAVDDILAWYDAESALDVVGSAGGLVTRGHAGIRRAWLGPLAGRYDVRRVAGIETGWGWVRADWVKDGQPGYAYFWIEEDRIRRHRHVVVGARETQGALRTPSRRPVFGVGAVVFDDHHRVLLVKRLHEPLAGQWSLPGGRLEIGETLEAATARELLEETGLHVDVGPLVEVFDRILLDADGNVQHHYVIADYLCTVRCGELCAQSDVSDAAWVSIADVPAYIVTDKARDVIAKARRMAE